MSAIGIAVGRPGVLRYVRLTVLLGQVSVRRLVEYRTVFVLGVLGFVARVGIQTVLIGTVFSFVPTLDGWTYPRALFLFGFSLLPRGVDRLFTDHLWAVGGSLIRSGEFYRHLLRPVNPLFSVVSERLFWPDALGELAVGVALIGYSTHRMGLSPAPWPVLVGSGLVACGAAIYASVKLLFASIAFWTTTSFPGMHAANQVSEFASYPLGVYGPPLRRVLTWVLPFAFTAYFPARYLLSGDARAALLTPVAAAASLAVSYLAWRTGLKRYEMTGS